MDKSEFLHVAPAYYYAAVAIALENTEGIFTVETLKEFYTTREGRDENEFLTRNVLIDFALAKMLAEGAVSETTDAFGDSLFQKTGMFEKVVTERLSTDASGPYYKNKAANNYGRWIRGALSSVNDRYFELGITPKDFEQELVDDWAPIPIDQADPALQDAIATLDDTIQQVEQSNGYASQHAGERQYVLDGIKALSNTLKTASSVSVQYVKRNGFEMLKRIRERFTGSIIDGSAKAASDALLHWIKEKAVELFTYFLGGF